MANDQPYTGSRRTNGIDHINRRHLRFVCLEKDRDDSTLLTYILQISDVLDALQQPSILARDSRQDPNLESGSTKNYDGGWHIALSLSI